MHQCIVTALHPSIHTCLHVPVSVGNSVCCRTQCCVVLKVILNSVKNLYILVYMYPQVLVTVYGIEHNVALS